jgi:hypothetical protein
MGGRIGSSPMFHDATADRADVQFFSVDKTNEGRES